jgi:dTDP-L-rhamnose 4-epimerase
MKILITGGAGFIGGHTADALIAAGHSVRVLDNLMEPVHRNGVPSYLSEGAELVVGDVRNKYDWARVLEGVDVVYHLAAYQDYLTDFSKFFHVNTVGTSLLYEVAVEKNLPLKKVIVASSQAAYGEGRYTDADGVAHYPAIRGRSPLEAGCWELTAEGRPLTPQWTDESVVNPQNQYAVSKYTQELVALSLGQRYDIPTVCMRYSIVQGPRQSLYNAYSGACRIFSLSCFFDKQPIVYEDGLQIRDFVNIEDVVQANLLVMRDHRADYQVFNVGGGCQYTVLEFAELASQVYGREFKPTVAGEFRFGDTRHIMSDISKLKGLGWEPKRDARYSLECYKAWLEKQQASPEIVEYAYKKMRETNVVGTVRK